MSRSRPLLLLVDDDPNLGFIVGRLGRQAGYEVEARGDAGAAWERLRQGAARPDLVLLDLSLPGVSGPELCARLREDPALADLPVALFTVAGGGDAVAAGLAAGGDFVVWKDLLTRPGAWAERLGEVLTAACQPAAVPALGEGDPGGLCLAAADVIQRLNRGLCQPSVRQAGAPVLEVLVQRALGWVRWWQTERGIGSPPPRAPWRRGAAGGNVVDPGSLALSPDLAGRLAPAGSSLIFAVALAEQLHRVLGPPAAAPLRAQLVGLAPTLASVLTFR